MPDVYPYKGVKYGFPSGRYYGDCSGGKYTRIPVLRKCGAGIVCYNQSEGEIQFTSHFDLPGHIQTVPRGELFAVLYVVLKARKDSTIHFVTDNKGNLQLFHNKEEALRSMNKDIFDLLYETITDDRINFTLT